MGSTLGNFPTLRAVADTQGTDVSSEPGASEPPASGEATASDLSVSGERMPTHGPLSAHGHVETGLSGLLRAMQRLNAGVERARTANDGLSSELLALGPILEAANERQLELLERVAALEAEAERVQADFARERRFLYEQQDAFIASLLEDHERELRRRGSDGELLKNTLRDLETLRAAELRERDEALRQVIRLETELERARVALRSQSDPPPRSRPNAAPQSSSTPQSNERGSSRPPLELDQSEMASAFSRTGPKVLGRVLVRSQSSSDEIVRPQASADEENTNPGIGPNPLAAEPPSSDPPPPLKQKPDASTRPLIGYSLGSEEVEPEQVEVGRGPRSQR